MPALAPMPNILTPTFEPGVTEQLAKGSQSDLMYWRTTRNEVILGSAAPHALLSYSAMGYIPLGKYGQYPSASGPGAWRTNEDNYRAILSHPEGLAEFGLEQLIELQWHVRPHPILRAQIERLMRQGATEDEALKAVIPQFDGVDLEQYRKRCASPECADRIFISDAALRSHETIHVQEVRQREQSKLLAEALSASGAQQTALLAALIEQLTTSQSTMAQQHQQQFMELVASLLPQQGGRKAGGS